TPPPPQSPALVLAVTKRGAPAPEPRSRFAVSVARGLCHGAFRFGAPQPWRRRLRSPRTHTRFGHGGCSARPREALALRTASALRSDLLCPVCLPKWRRRPRG